MQLGMQTCAVPSCQRRVPGRSHDFCADHFFALRRAEAMLILRTRIEFTCCSEGDTKQHLNEQLAGYVSAAVRRLTQPQGDH